MILYDTPYNKIYDTLKDEEKKIDFALKKQEDRDVRALLRNGTKRGLLCNDYTVPASHNRYVLFTEVNVHGHHAYVHSDAMLSLTDHGGKKMYIRTASASNAGDDGRKNTEHRLEIITAHCLHRFRERTGLPSDLSTEHVLWQLLQTNVNIAKIHHKLVSNDRQAASEYGCAYQNSRGLFLGTEQEGTDRHGKPFYAVRYNTFVNNELLRHGQVKHLLPKDLLEYLDNAYEFQNHLP